MENTMITTYMDYGLLGLTVAVLLLVTWKLWNSLQESQNKRIEEAVGLTKVVEGVKHALDNLSDIIKSASH